MRAQLCGHGLPQHRFVASHESVVPSSFPYLYADNWETVTGNVIDAHQASDAIDDFAMIIDVGLDKNKTHWWATSADARAELRQSHPRVAQHAKDLGVEVAYTRKRTTSGLLARALRKSRTSRQKSGCLETSHVAQSIPWWRI